MSFLSQSNRRALETGLTTSDKSGVNRESLGEPAEESRALWRFVMNGGWEREGISMPADADAFLPAETSSMAPREEAPKILLVKFSCCQWDRNL